MAALSDACRWDTLLPIPTSELRLDSKARLQGRWFHPSWEDGELGRKKTVSSLPREPRMAPHRKTFRHSVAEVFAGYFRLHPEARVASVKVVFRRASDDERSAELASYLAYCRYFDDVFAYYGRAMPPSLAQSLREELTDRLVGYWKASGISFSMQATPDGKVELILEDDGDFSELNRLAHQVASRYRGSHIVFSAWNSDITGGFWDPTHKLIWLGKYSALRAPFQAIDRATPHEVSHAETTLLEATRQASPVLGFIVSEAERGDTGGRRGLPPLYPNVYARQELNGLDEMASMLISARQIVHQMEHDPLTTSSYLWQKVAGKGLVSDPLLEILRNGGETARRAQLAAQLGLEALSDGHAIRYFDGGTALSPSAVLTLDYRGRRFELNLALVKSEGKHDPNNPTLLREQLSALYRSATHHLEVLHFAQLAYDRMAALPSVEEGTPLIRALRRVLDEAVPLDPSRGYSTEELVERYNRYLGE